MSSDAPLLSVDLSSGVPVYRQIVDAIRALLVNGNVRPGDTLPSVRQVAIDLGLNGAAAL
jgi:GntR family transcriptional regulator